MHNSTMPARPRVRRSADSAEVCDTPAFHRIDRPEALLITRGGQPQLVQHRYLDHSDAYDNYATTVRAQPFSSGTFSLSVRWRTVVPRGNTP
jgi:hypothetical protein